MKGKNKKYDELSEEERKELENSLNPEQNQNVIPPQNQTLPVVNTGEITNERILKVLQSLQEDLNNQKMANSELLKRIEDDKNKQIKQKVDQAIQDAITKGRISPKDEEGKKKWEKRLSDNYDDQIELLNSLQEQKFKPDTPEGINNNKGANSTAYSDAKTLDRASLVKEAREAFKTNK